MKVDSISCALCRIHTQGNAVHNKTHPDSRAIFYEERTYSKKKIQDFTATLKGFEVALKVATMLQGKHDSCLSSPKSVNNQTFVAFVQILRRRSCYSSCHVSLHRPLTELFLI